MLDLPSGLWRDPPAHSPCPQPQREHKSTPSEIAAGEGSGGRSQPENSSPDPRCGRFRAAEHLPAPLLHRRSSAGAGAAGLRRPRLAVPIRPTQEKRFPLFFFMFFSPSALSFPALKGNALPLSSSAFIFFSLKIRRSRRPPEPSADLKIIIIIIIIGEEGGACIYIKQKAQKRVVKKSALTPLSPV